MKFESIKAGMQLWRPEKLRALSYPQEVAVIHSVERWRHEMAK